MTKIKKYKVYNKTLMYIAISIILVTLGSMYIHENYLVKNTTEDLLVTLSKEIEIVTKKYYSEYAREMISVEKLIKENVKHGTDEEYKKVLELHEDISAKDIRKYYIVTSKKKIYINDEEQKVALDKEKIDLISKGDFEKSNDIIVIEAKKDVVTGENTIGIVKKYHTVGETGQVFEGIIVIDFSKDFLQELSDEITNNVSTYLYEYFGLLDNLGFYYVNDSGIVEVAMDSDEMLKNIQSIFKIEMEQIKSSNKKLMGNEYVKYVAYKENMFDFYILLTLDKYIYDKYIIDFRKNATLLSLVILFITYIINFSFVKKLNKSIIAENEKIFREGVEHLASSSEMANEIEKKTDLLDSIINISDFGIWNIFDGATMYFHNPKWYDIYTQGEQSVNLNKWRNLMHPDDREFMKSAVDLAVVKKETKLDLSYRLITTDGDYRWIKMLGKLNFDENGNPEKIFGIHIDETMQKKYDESLYKLAYYDELTGLPNRTYLMKKLGNTIKENVEGIIMCLDIDNFKTLNEIYGHKLGDEIIKSLAEKMTHELPDAFVSRVGGDELEIIYPYKKKNPKEKSISRVPKSKDAIDEIISIIKKPITFADNVVSINATIGGMEFPMDDYEVEDYIKNVDTALYYAKEKNKGGYQIYNDEIRQMSDEKIYIETNMKAALENEEFFLVYQPIISLKDPDEMYFEALIRWRHRGNIISPGKFIPIFEDTKFIKKVGVWVLEESCRFINKMKKESEILPKISVNISVVQFEDDNFIEDIQRIIKTYDIDTKQLIFEMTESVMYSEQADIINKILQLSEIGINVALDDYGSGYSSMYNVITLPIKIIKIDKSIIDQIILYDSLKKFVASLIEFAHETDLKVVAEGIELVEQIELLKEIDCDYIQGFYYSKPIVGEKVGDYIQYRNRII